MISKGRQMRSITFAIPVAPEDPTIDPARLSQLIEFVAGQEAVTRILVAYERHEQLASIKEMIPVPQKIEFIRVDGWISASAMTRILERSDDGLLLALAGLDLRFERNCIDKFIEAAAISGAGLVYSDHRQRMGAKVIECPAIGYREGCIRDTFNFGPLVLISTRAAKEAFSKYGHPSGDLRWHGFYDLRLKLSIDNRFMHVAEALYVRNEAPVQRSRSRAMTMRDVFYAVDRGAHAFEIEAENVATAHLRRIGAYVKAGSAPLPPQELVEEFPVMASIIIPTRNRDRTLREAIDSALVQSTSFTYNIIIVDDHSTDSTEEIIRAASRCSDRIIHMVPSRNDLGIGGMWNEAIYSKHCGLYAVQLDSDDVFAHEQALEMLINEFSEGSIKPAMDGLVTPRYAMVLGSYLCVDADLAEIPSGLDQPPELSRENVRNKLLCVDGPSAPRAFYVPVLRRFGFPNVSFGEDYAIALRIAREYDVGRVFEPVYLVRRWDENTTRSLSYGSLKGVSMKELMPDAVNKRELWSRLEPIVGPLTIASRNHGNTYKDYLRTIEIQARREINRRRTQPDDCRNGIARAIPGPTAGKSYV